jgi:hypothetical protein
MTMRCCGYFAPAPLYILILLSSRKIIKVHVAVNTTINSSGCNKNNLIAGQGLGKWPDERTIFSYTVKKNVEMAIFVCYGNTTSQEKEMMNRC